MILNEKELEVCLKYAIEPILKQNDILIKEYHLTINEHICLNAVVIYQDYVIDIQGHFDLNYRNGYLCFEHIDGKIEYLFLKLNIMNVLKQFIHSPHVSLKENSCLIQYSLPIQLITIENNYLNIQLTI